MSAFAATGLPQPPQYSAALQAGSGDVLSSIRRMIAEDGQGGAPAAASPLPLRLQGPVLRLDSPVGGQGLPPLRLGGGDSPEATRLRVTALREAIRARVPAPESAVADAAPVAAFEAAGEASAPVIEPEASRPEAAMPEAPAPVAPVAAAPAAPPPAEAPSPEPAASPAAGFFGEMIREVLRQELRGESLDRMSGDLRSMVLREVARAITGGPAEGGGR